MYPWIFWVFAISEAFPFRWTFSSWGSTEKIPVSHLKLSGAVCGTDRKELDLFGISQISPHGWLHPCLSKQQALLLPKWNLICERLWFSFKSFCGLGCFRVIQDDSSQSLSTLGHPFSAPPSHLVPVSSGTASFHGRPAVIHSSKCASWLLATSETYCSFISCLGHD